MQEGKIGGNRVKRGQSSWFEDEIRTTFVLN